MQAITAERTASSDTDINSGLDYERARDRLQVIAGELFGKFLATMGDSDVEAHHRIRREYQAARNAAADLHPRDADLIAAVLRGEA